MCDIDLTEKSYCLGDGSECNPRSNISVAGSDHVWEGNATDARGEQGLPVDSAASPRDSYQREMDHKFEILSHRLEQLVNNLKAENGNQILLNNRIIVISLAVVSVPISCLLILILYLTLRRDKKIVKSEHRLALNEMNHLRRYNDY